MSSPAAKSEVRQGFRRRLADFLEGQAVTVDAVVRWIGRRTVGVPTGAREIRYGKDQIAVVGLFAVLTAGEVVAVELLIPWAALRIALLVLGGYGLVLMVGFVAINRTRPHVLHGRGIRLRCGRDVDITLDARDVGAVMVGIYPAGDRPAIHDGTLTMGVGGTARVQLVLAEPQMLRVGDVDGEVRRIRISADDPAAAARGIRQFAADAAETTDPDPWPT